MSKIVVLLRCQTWNTRIAELAHQLQAAIPEAPVHAIPDCINLSPEDEKAVCEEFQISTLPLTREFVEASGLHLRESKTGWLCGDYVLYRALELEWDFAWVIEPDVFFLNGAEDILSKMQRLNQDLLATHLRKAEENWVWTRALRNLIHDQDVHAMAFPFFRASRELAEASLALRQNITSLLQPGDVIPNDESILATAAFNTNASTLDIKELYEDRFEFWSTITRVSVEDIAECTEKPLIVHSGQSRKKFIGQMQSYWFKTLEGSDSSKARLFKSLETASKQTILQFLNEILTSRRL